MPTRWFHALLLILASHLAYAEAPAPVPATHARAAPLLAAAVDDITRQVVALRGLKLQRPVVKGVLSRAQIGVKLEERIAKDYSPEEVKAEAQVLKRLGLLPAAADYQRLLTDLLMEQVAGFYDPYARELYIADWIGDDLQRPALAHEIEHVLQDQHFDLKVLGAPLKDDGDRQLAHSALIEGDGTAVMLEFVLQGMGLDIGRLPAALSGMMEKLSMTQLSQTPRLAAAPPIVRETLTFPYFAGLRFIMALRSQYPWRRIDEVFRKPPESTEQILHPEKYLAGERPIPIVVTPLGALAPQRELRRDVWGELAWKILLSTHLDAAQAESAAAGWGGDRLVAYGNGPDLPTVAIFSVWDSDADAQEAEEALAKWMARATAQTSPTLASAAKVYESNGQAWSVERRGRQILAWFGIDTPLRTAASDEVWRNWKVGRPDAKESPRRAKK